MAAPLSPFLLVVPMKTSYEVSLVEFLKTAFKDGAYSSKEGNLPQNIEEFNKFRAAIANKALPKTSASLALLYRYHDQLVALRERLPTLAVNPPSVKIYWDDALDKGGLLGGKQYITTSSLEVERLCVLFNIASLQSHLASECRAADTDEELKNSAKYFQSAASIFDVLSKAKVEGCVLTQDMNPDVLAALSALMLAQAQEVFVDKAVKDRMKDTIVAKLCIVAEQLFGDAAGKMNKDTITHVWDRSWLSNVSAKKLSYTALSQYFQSQLCAQNKHYGEQISRLDVALKGIKKAQNKMGSTQFLSTFVPDMEQKLKDARKDNDFIYNEVIPKEEDLMPVERSGGARLVKLSPIPEKFSFHFVDIFDSAVKKGGGDGGGDGPSLKSIINTAAGQLGQLLVNMSKNEKK